jgi:predicted small lipoprotein YifL
MRYTLAALTLGLVLPLLGGCGQMGPLYLPPPDEAQPVKPVAPAQNSPQQTEAP